MEQNLELFLEKNKKRLTEKQIEMIEYLSKIDYFNLYSHLKEGTKMTDKPNTVVFLHESPYTKIEFTIEF